MSGGTTAAYVTMAVTVAAAAMSAAGQIQQQKAQEKTAKNTAAYNAQVAENEAATQQSLAQNEIQKGIADRERQQRAAARAMGEMRAGMGASGFTMDDGTSASLLEESAMEHQYDSNIINQNANQAAWQHLVGRTNSLNNKAMADYQGANASSGRAGAYLGAGGTLLGGIASGVNSYSSLKAAASANPNNSNKAG